MREPALSAYGTASLGALFPDAGSFRPLPSLVEASELRVIPERVAKLYASQCRLKVIALPVSTPDFAV